MLAGSSAGVVHRSKDEVSTVALLAASPNRHSDPATEKPVPRTCRTTEEPATATEGTSEKMTGELVNSKGRRSERPEPTPPSWIEVRPVCCAGDKHVTRVEHRKLAWTSVRPKWHSMPSKKLLPAIVIVNPPAAELELGMTASSTIEATKL
eukprot:914961-Rhodomonas_salina.2